MPDSLAIQPQRAFRTTVRPPGSKSLTNRALLLAALADGRSTLSGLLLADDTRVMLAALRDLGFALELDEAAHTVSITGRAGALPAPRADLSLGNAGTAYRFLTAACCLGPGPYTLDGVPRMRERPIAQLVDPLRHLGATIAYLGKPGYPPLQIGGAPGHALRGGELLMQPTLSSQYISALLQIAPLLPAGLTLRFAGPVTSRPYVEMTLGLMARFGVTADVDAAFTCIRVAPGRYHGTDYPIEPDASAASYFLAAAAIIPGSACTIDGLGKGSLQGDIGFADLLHRMGAGLLYGRDFITVLSPPAGDSLRGIDVDLNHMPDVALTLSAIAPLAKGPTVIRNVGNLRVKETDRLSALRNELLKVGAGVAIDGDDLHITPPPDGRLRPAAIDTYDDHRMAMAFAILGLAYPEGGLVINHPGCVAKTFPDFFEYLGRLGQTDF